VKEKKEEKRIDAIENKEEETAKEEGQAKKVTESPPPPDMPIKRRTHTRGIWVYVIVHDNKGISFALNIKHKAEEDQQKKDEEAKKGLKTYTNISALFSFDYPDTWALNEQNNALIMSSDTNYPKAYLAGEGPEMKDSDIYIQIHFSNQPLDISREAPAIRPKFSNITIGGVEAKKVTYQNETDFQEIIQNFQAGDFYFLITCDTKTENSDKIDAYKKMLDSFKFGNDVIEAT
jgi:hypothetical protein